MEYTTKTIKVGNAIVRVHKPILSEAEYKKREEKVIEALTRFGYSMLEQQEKTERK